MPSVTRYPSIISADGWANPNRMKVEDGSLSTYPGASMPDIVATGFGFAADVPACATLKKLAIGVKASATSTGEVQPAFDQLRVILNSEQLEEPHLHGAGVPGSLEWCEDTLESGDLSGAGISAAQVRDSSFGLAAAFYNRSGLDTGTAAISVDALRITVEWE